MKRDFLSVTDFTGDEVRENLALAIEVKAKTKKDKEKFTFSIGWYNETLIEEGEDIKITSKKPAGDVVEIETSDDDE